MVLDALEVWAFEASHRLRFVHSAHGRFEVDLPLLEIELVVGRAFVRAHRQWLVNVANVREMRSGPYRRGLWVANSVAEGATGIRIPIARDVARAVRQRLLEGTVGLRHDRRAD